MRKTDIELEDALKTSPSRKTAKTKRRKTYTYETLISSGCDFAIRRYNDKDHKILVAYVSQDLFCIYDEDKKEKKDITVSRDVSSFFFDKQPNDVVIPRGTASYIKYELTKKEASVLFKVLLMAQDIPSLKFALKKGILDPMRFFNEDESSREMDLNLLYDLSPTLCTDILKNSMGYLPNQWQFIFIKSCYDSFGLDITREIFSGGLPPKFTLDKEIDFSKYNLDGQRFANYIKTNFFNGNKNTIGHYVDYLEMAKTKDHVIKDKYPKHLVTAHDKMKAELNEEALLKKSFPEFEDVIMDSRDYTYENELDDFSIVMPQKASDLVVEGMTLGHCVSVYAPKVIAGDCMIVFMREKDTKDVPYLTVEIVKDKYITEIEGANKRTDLTDKEIVFIKAFARAFDLEITASNALRHVIRKAA